MERRKWLPHIVVETSPQRWHAYWLVTDLPLADFRAVQKTAIERFKGDPAVCDLSRVMRLPGFMHCKGEPFQVRIASINEQPAYPGAIFRTPKTINGHAAHVANEPVAPLELVRAAVAVIPNLDVPWDEYNLMGMAIWGATNGSDAGCEIFVAWSAK